MIARSVGGTDCVIHNMVPLCRTCNGAMGSNPHFEFLITDVTMEVMYRGKKSKPITYTEVINYLKANIGCVAYSQFIIDEMSYSARKIQLDNVRQIFIAQVGWEPRDDLDANLNPILNEVGKYNSQKFISLDPFDNFH